MASASVLRAAVHAAPQPGSRPDYSWTLCPAGCECHCPAQFPLPAELPVVSQAEGSAWPCLGFASGQPRWDFFWQCQALGLPPPAWASNVALALWAILTLQVWTRQWYNWPEAMGRPPEITAFTPSQLIRIPRGGLSEPAPTLPQILTALGYCGVSRSHSGIVLLDQ